MIGFRHASTVLHVPGWHAEVLRKDTSGLATLELVELAARCLEVAPYAGRHEFGLETARNKQHSQCLWAS